MCEKKVNLGNAGLADEKRYQRLDEIPDEAGYFSLLAAKRQQGYIFTEENEMNSMKGAIFDMDGLLFDTEQVYQKNWTRLAKELDVDLPDAFRRSICGTSGDLMDHLIEQYYHVENGHPYAEKVMGWTAEDLKKSVPEKKGIREILNFFRERKFKIAIASSSRRAQIQNNLHLAHIEEYFDALVSGRDDGVKKGKPAPDIFLKAAERIGLSASECYVFEDAYNGIRAAAAAGACPIMIPDMIPADEEMRKLSYGIYPDLIAARDALKEKMERAG